MVSVRSTVFATLALWFAAPTVAQDEPSDSETSAWTHSHTGIIVPPLIGDFQRTQINQLLPDETNLTIDFHDPSTQTIATVYLFRAGADNISIWGDRAVLGMFTNSDLGAPVAGENLLGRFSPPNGENTPSGLHAVTNLSGKEWQATGVSLFGHDGWLVKIRMSSKTLKMEQVTSAIGKFVAEIAPPQSTKAYPTVELIQSCEDKIKFPKKVGFKKMDLVGTLIMGTITSPNSNEEYGVDTPNETWCRDPQSAAQYGIYRKDGDKRSAFIAFGDAGFSAVMGRMKSTEILNRSYKGYTVTLSDGVTEEVWPPMTALPSPGSVLSMIDQVSPIAKRDVGPNGDGQSTIIINSSVTP